MKKIFLLLEARKNIYLKAIMLPTVEIAISLAMMIVFTQMMRIRQNAVPWVVTVRLFYSPNTASGQMFPNNLHFMI